MVALGFSLYPDKHPEDKVIAYVDKLASKGFKRAFLSLLQLDLEDSEMIAKYQRIIGHCKAQNLFVVVDINERVHKFFNQEGSIIDSAESWGIGGIRLDEFKMGRALIDLVENKAGIKIEFNSSTDMTTIPELIAHHVKMDNVIGCHNFYPHRLTGISRPHFMKYTQLYASYQIENSAFVNVASANEGPWQLNEGLCTLEEHRMMRIDNQIRMLVATKKIQNIILANQFISDEELELVLSVDLEKISFAMHVEKGISDIERTIIGYAHNYRGDVSEYVLRSTMPRVVFKDESVPPRMVPSKVQRGTVLIDNDLYGRYKGELHIALRDFEIDNKVNIVGRLTDEALSYLDLLMPWEDFNLITEG